MAETKEIKVEVWQKAKASFGLKLKRDGDGEDLSTNDDIIIYFPGTSATQSVSKQGGEITVLDATKGKIQVTIPAAKTELMAVGEEQNFLIHVIQNSGDDPIAWEVLGCLYVNDTIA